MEENEIIEIEESEGTSDDEESISIEGISEGLEIEEEEPPMYVVMPYEGPELFGFYVLLILSLIIVYPIFRVVRHAVGGVKRWR